MNRSSRMHHADATTGLAKNNLPFGTSNSSPRTNRRGGRVGRVNQREFQMTRTRVAVAALMLAITVPAMADTIRVGGQPMFPNKTIVGNAVNSADHTTLVAAVKAASLVDTLNSPGPFTVFAPVHAAFSALPAGTVDTLLKPENKGMLTSVLTYH